MPRHAMVNLGIHQLADEIGELIAYWGFKKVYGRIWSHLILSSKGLDASDLIHRLDISKALVSMSLNEMSRMNVVEEFGKSERGTQLYRANPDIFSVISNVLRLRERQMLRRIHLASKATKRIPVQVYKRQDLHEKNIKALYEIISEVVDALENFLRNLRFDLSSTKKHQLSGPAVKRVAARG
jgi:DNA-binding transcriptional regulator GbsR (MarR family)